MLVKALVHISLYEKRKFFMVASDCPADIQKKLPPTPPPPRPEEVLKRWGTGSIRRAGIKFGISPRTVLWIGDELLVYDHTLRRRLRLRTWCKLSVDALPLLFLPHSNGTHIVMRFMPNKRAGTMWNWPVFTIICLKIDSGFANDTIQ